MLSEFGRAVRRFRDEAGVSLKEMADFLEIPSSYLSAIEHGNKKISEKVLVATQKFFGRNGPSLDEWREIATRSPTHVKLDMRGASTIEQEVYLAVGQKFKQLPHELKKEIRDLLNQGDE